MEKKCVLSTDYGYILQYDNHNWIEVHLKSQLIVKLPLKLIINKNKIKIGSKVKYIIAVDSENILYQTIEIL